MGGLSVGSNSNRAEAVLPLQSRARHDILAISTYSSARSETKYYCPDNGSLDRTLIIAAYVFTNELLAAIKGHIPHTKRGTERVRHQVCASSNSAGGQKRWHTVLEHRHFYGRRRLGRYIYAGNDHQ